MFEPKNKDITDGCWVRAIRGLLLPDVGDAAFQDDDRFQVSVTSYDVSGNGWQLANEYFDLTPALEVIPDPTVKKMTVAQVAKALGHGVEIVEGD